MKNFLNLGEFFGYFFRKADPNRPTSFNLRTMHIINKVSMGMFLVCLIVMLVRLFTR